MTTHYGNGEKGLRYSVSSLGSVTSISLGPSLKDNGLRCAGFPPTDGGITAYTPSYRFSYETLEHVQEGLGEFGVRLLKAREFKGYAVVYATPSQKKDLTAKVVSGVRKYLLDEPGVELKSVEIIEGGYREEPTVELFLIPREWPRVVPTPTLGGYSND